MLSKIPNAKRKKKTHFISQRHERDSLIKQTTTAIPNPQKMNTTILSPLSLGAQTHLAISKAEKITKTHPSHPRHPPAGSGPARYRSFYPTPPSNPS